jgi:ribosomal protein L37AE/L43A
VNRPHGVDDTSEGRAAPASCPFCQSSKVKAATEKVDASTYWRCESCGEMWNVSRLRMPNRNRYGGR